MSSGYNQWTASSTRAFPSVSPPSFSHSIPSFVQRPLLRNILRPIMSTTTQDTNKHHTRHTHRGLQLPSPQIPKGLVSFLPSAFLPLLPLEMIAGKAPVMVRWAPTYPTTPTFAPPPQRILPSTPSSSLRPLIPILLCPIHAIILHSSLPCITRINYP